MICPDCGSRPGVGDRYCRRCGLDLYPPPPAGGRWVGIDWAMDELRREELSRPDLVGVPVDRLVICPAPACGEVNSPERLRCWICNRSLLD